VPTLFTVYPDSLKALEFNIKKNTAETMNIKKFNMKTITKRIK
jgi:hypothetical protein